MPKGTGKDDKPPKIRASVPSTTKPSAGPGNAPRASRSQSLSTSRSPSNSPSSITSATKIKATEDTCVDTANSQTPTTPADDTITPADDPILAVDGDNLLPKYCTSHRTLDKCPCGKSSGKSSWMIDCSRCHQEWHLECVTLNGLASGSINKLVDYLGPCCYVPPIKLDNCGPNTDVDLCHLCRNTDTLGKVNNLLELNLIENYQKKLSELTKTFETLNNDLEKKLLYLQQVSQSTDGTTGITKPPITDPLIVPPVTSPTIGLPPCPEEPIHLLTHDFLDLQEQSEIRKFLDECRDNGDFMKHKGRETLAFGSLYKWSNIYNGKASKEREQIPGVLKNLLEKAKERCGDGAEDFNSVLINYYPEKTNPKDPSSHIPAHSDNEMEIKPNSMIATYSIGASRELVFTSKHSTDEESVEVEDNSLYLMTKSSQHWFKHAMHDVATTEERYSVTMRCVDPNLSRGTLIVGDSNCKEIKFGSGRGTIGEKYPGKLIKAGQINDIDPLQCMGWANVVILCGTNDLRPGPHPPNVEDLSNKLFEKVLQIRKLSPYSKVFLIPVLPTRDRMMNNHVMSFNRRVGAWVTKIQDSYISHPSVSELLDQYGLLSREFVRNANDLIHLGPRGLSKFVQIVKNAIYFKEKNLKSLQGVPKPKQTGSREPV